MVIEIETSSSSAGWQSIIESKEGLNVSTIKNITDYCLYPHTCCWKLALELHEAVRLHDPPPRTRPPKSCFLQLMATLLALTWTCMFFIQRKHLRSTAPACISPWCLIIWRPSTLRPWRRVGWRSLTENEIITMERVRLLSIRREWGFHSCNLVFT